jgi:hypothetical protein
MSIFRRGITGILGVVKWRSRFVAQESTGREKCA